MLTPYHYEYLAQELFRNKDFSRLHALLLNSPNWMETSFAASQNDENYARALDLAIGRLHENLSWKELKTLLKLSAARQIVYQRANNFSKSYLQTLVWLGNRELAEKYASQASTSKSLFQSLWAIYEAEKAFSGSADMALLGELRELLHRMDSDAKEEFTVSILGEYYEMENTQPLLEFLEDIPVENYLHSVGLLGLAQKTLNTELFDEIEKQVIFPESEDQKIFVYMAMAKASQELKHYERAETLRNELEGFIENILDPATKIVTMASLATSYIELGNEEKLNSLFRQAIDGLKEIDADPLREYIAGLLIGHANKANLPHIAEEIAEQMTYKWLQAIALCRIVSTYHSMNQGINETLLEKIERLCDEIEDDKSNVMAFLAMTYAELSIWENAEQCLGQISNTKFLKDTYSDLALIAAKQKQDIRAAAYLKQSQNIPFLYQAPVMRVKALCQIIEWRIQNEAEISLLAAQVNKIISELESYTSEHAAVDELIKTAIRLMRPDLLSNLLTVVQDTKSDLVVGLAQYFISIGYDEGVQNCLGQVGIDSYSSQIYYEWAEALIARGDLLQATKAIDEMNSNQNTILSYISTAKEFNTNSMNLSFQNMRLKLLECLILHYFREGNSEQAQNYLKELLSEEANANKSLLWRTQFLVALTRVYYLMADKDCAKQYLQEAQETALQNMAYTDQALALSYVCKELIHQNQLDKAIDLLKNISVQTAEFREVLELILQYCIENQQIATAEELAQTYLGSNNFTNSCLADYYIKQGQYAFVLQRSTQLSLDEYLWLAFRFLAQTKLEEESTMIIVTQVVKIVAWLDNFWLLLFEELKSSHK